MKRKADGERSEPDPKPSAREKWEDAITRALRKKKPPEGWPEKPKRDRGYGGGGAGSGGT